MQTVPRYELVASHNLPVINVKRTLLHELFSPATSRSITEFWRLVHTPIVFMYVAGFPIGAAALTVSPILARPLAVIKIALQLPVLISASTDLQIDILRCLCATYEFWFFSILNAMTCVIFMLHLGDLRMIMIPAYWYGIQMNVWSDAKIEAKQLAGGAILAAVYHVFLLVIFGFNMLPEPRTVFQVSLGGHIVTSQEFLTNSFATLFILMVRTAYRKRKLGKMDKNNPQIVHFASYQCRLRVCVPLVQDPSEPTRPTSSDVRAAEAMATPQKLRLCSQIKVYNENSILVPGLVDWKAVGWHRMALKATGMFGFLSNVMISTLALNNQEGTDQHADRWLYPLSIAALLASTMYCGLHFGLYHRQLLVHLLTSFDVLFVTLQVTCAQAALCDMLRWNWRSLMVLTGWIWRIHVTTSDALTLDVRRRLHMRRRILTMVVLIDIIGQAHVALLLLQGGAHLFHDRVLLRLDFWGPKAHDVRMASFFLGRAFTTMTWSLRLLWRVLTSANDELIKITGSVEFDGNPHAGRRQRRERFSLHMLHIKSGRVHPNQSLEQI